jgi:putative Ca2+/H+ antiporter (TMEM165/GDT1 family)
MEAGSWGTHSFNPPPVLRPLSSIMQEGVGKAFSDMGGIVAATVGPLIMTSVRHEPKAVAAGTALSLLLSKMTFNIGSPPSAFDAKLESVALGKNMITGDANRYTRMLLGCIYLYAAVKFSARSARSEKERVQSKAQTPLLSKLGSWTGTSVLCMVAAVWISTGYYGQ